MNATNAGLVALVGAGPGDPKLITLAGAEALARAECVVYDKLVDARLLDLAPAAAERIYVGKNCGDPRPHVTQEDINRILIVKAKAGLRVVRLKGGDPLLFARGGEEAEALRAAGVAYSIIPGVTAAVAAAAGSGIPLTHRLEASAVACITGHEDPAKSPRLDWGALAAFPGTLVVYMPLARRRAIAAELVARGKNPATPVAFVAWGGTNRQQTATLSLADLAAGREPADLVALPSPAVAIIGAVCSYRERLRWFEDRPLFGRRLLLLRPPAQAAEWTDALESAGADVLGAPAFDIVPPADLAALDAAIRRASGFDWIVFASPSVVEEFCRRVWDLGLDARALAGPRLAAVGAATVAALARMRLRADLVPADPRAEGLAAELAPLARGRRFLLPRADRGRTLLEDALRAAGAEVEPVVAYVQQDRAAPPTAVGAALAAGEVDWALLTSPNAAAAFFRWQEAAGPGAANVRLASIGPTTTAAIVATGRKAGAEAQTPDVTGMIAALTGAGVTSSSS